MSKTIIPVALLSSPSLIVSFALAADPAYPSNPERTLTTQAAPAARTRVEVRAELADFRKNPVSADRWQDIGGERGSKFMQHKIALIDGKLAHSNDGDHSAPPGSSLSMSAEVTAQYRTNDRNAL